MDSENLNFTYGSRSDADTKSYHDGVGYTTIDAESYSPSTQ
jgi:hypothetical protein